MMWRQGDVFIQAIGAIPSSARAAPLPHGTLVHGELTGHSHRVDNLDSATVFSGQTPNELFLEVKAKLARIVHEEHAPIQLAPGSYRVWRQREYSPEAIRVVVD